jgi:hypothetical protein
MSRHGTVPASIKASVAGHERWRTVFGLLEQSQDGPTQKLVGVESIFCCGGDANMVMLGSPIYGHYPTMRSSQNDIAAIAAAIGKVSSSFALPQCGT